MPTYTYEGEPDRYYPTLALTPEPDSSHDLEKNPGDGRWTPPDPDPAGEPAAPETAEAAPAAKAFGFRSDAAAAAPTTEDDSDASAF